MAFAYKSRWMVALLAAVSVLPEQAAALTLSPPEPVVQPVDSTLNVLFIAVDDLRPAVGAFGDETARTPNIDRLAKRGLVFNRAYAQQAVCNPSRASVMTGRRPNTTKVWDNSTHFRAALPDVITLPQYFKQHGYHTQAVGKIYHDPAWAQDSLSWSAPERWSVTDDAGGKYVLNYTEHNGWKAEASERMEVPDNNYIDGRVADTSIETLEALKDRPFFLAVGFRRPHLPFSAPAKYWDLYDREELPLPDPAVPPDGAPSYALHNGVELRGYTDIPSDGPLPVEKQRELIHGYYASVSYVDAQIGRLLDKLDELGLRDNTLIVLWGDHGFHLGEQGLWCKRTNFELDTRVPLIVSDPAQLTTGRSTSALVELVDLYPTMVDLAGLPVPDGLEGASMSPLLTDPQRPWKKAAFSQFPASGDHRNVMGLSVRTDDLRYTEWVDTTTHVVHARELYEYASGPVETVNVASKPERNDDLSRLSALLDGGWREALPQGVGATGALRPERPNIVVILADDLGWADLGSYGNDIIETPQLDRLAAEGMRFTSAYSPAPICSASRAAVQTGRSPARLHFEFVTKPDGSDPPQGTLLRQPSFPRDLALAELTMAEEIGDSYATGFFGKWHLTQENDRYLGWGSSRGPLQQGYDDGEGTFGSHPYAYRVPGRTDRPSGVLPRGTYPADSLTQKAVAFVREHRDKPFMLFLSHYYVHTPVTSPANWLYEKYRMKLGPDAPEEEVHYAAFVETMDAYIGDFLDALNEYGLRERTVVFFTSDNGGHPEYTENGVLRGSKWNLYEGGIRVPMVVRWPDVIRPGRVSDVPVVGTDLFPTVLALAGSSYQGEVPIDGRNLEPLLRGSSTETQNSAIYWHFPFYHPPVVDTKPQSAVRVGDYKLIYFYEDDRSELYNLRSDIGEARDLSGVHPERAQQMKDKMFELLAAVNARRPHP